MREPKPESLLKQLWRQVTFLQEQSIIWQAKCEELQTENDQLRLFRNEELTQKKVV